MSIRYNVKIEKFAERHYIKSFEKKYKTHWEPTFVGIKKIMENIDSAVEDKIIDEIVCLGDLCVLKMDFRVDGTKYSKKESGNRCILSLNKKTKEVRILLVYHKSHLGKRNETATWKKMIRENYVGYDFCK